MPAETAGIPVFVARRLTTGARQSTINTGIYAAVVELADTRDLKSLGGDTVPVRARSAAPTKRARRVFLL